MVDRPSVSLPVITTDMPLQDPYDEDFRKVYMYGGSVHPTGNTCGPIAVLPRNFGRSSAQESNIGWAGGLVALNQPANFANNGTLMMHVHKKYGHVTDLGRGWVETPMWVNVGDPTFGSPIFTGIGAQDKGEYVYVAMTTLTGFGGSENTNLWRFNRMEFFELRYHFGGTLSNYSGAPIAREMFVTDTSPPFVFFCDGTGNVWHMKDDGINVGTYYYYTTGGYNDWGDYLGEPLQAHNVYSGQFGATRFDLPNTDPVRADRIYVDGNGSTSGDSAYAGYYSFSGMQIFRPWSAPTEWPEMWVATPHYRDPGNFNKPGWDYSFDIRRIPNANAGNYDHPTNHGWDPDWKNDKYLWGRTQAITMPFAEGPGSFNVRFHRDRKRRNTLWVTCRGGSQRSVYPTYSNIYNNCWYAKSLDDGKTWGRWQQGSTIYGGAITTQIGDEQHYDWKIVGNQGYESYQVPTYVPILSASNDLLMPINYAEYHGNYNVRTAENHTKSTRPATLYAMTYEGQGGGKGTEQRPIFKRGELNRATWL